MDKITEIFNDNKHNIRLVYVGNKAFFALNRAIALVCPEDATDLHKYKSEGQIFDYEHIAHCEQLAIKSKIVAINNKLYCTEFKKEDGVRIFVDRSLIVSFAKKICVDDRRLSFKGTKPLEPVFVFLDGVIVGLICPVRYFPEEE